VRQQRPNAIDATIMPVAMRDLSDACRSISIRAAKPLEFQKAARLECLKVKHVYFLCKVDIFDAQAGQG
jgi:hypothetical protein